MMHESLARWLHSVELEPGSERQSAIAEAAASIAKGLSPVSTLGFVRLALGSAEAEAFDTLRGELSGVDPTFGGAIDDLETRIIAVAVVAEALDRADETACQAVHGVLSAEFLGHAFPVPELPSLAADSQHRISESYRTRAQLDSTVELKANLGLPSFGVENQGVVHQEAQQLVDGISKAMTVVKRAHDLLVAQVERRLAASDEELDVLWWAFSGYSRVADRSWSQIRHEGAAAILMAAELVELVRFPIEPSSTKPILARLLGTRSNESVDFASVIAAAAKRELPAGLAAGHPLLPILSSLHEFRAMKGKPGWRQSVERWEISAGQSHSCIDLACQVVRELMMVHKLNDDE